MSAIKSYLELNIEEKKEILKFVNRNYDFEKTLEEIDRLFNNKVNNYGEGSLFCFLDQTVVGSILIVLEACENLGTIYICSIEVLEFEHKKQIVSSLIDSALKISQKYNPNSIFLGANTLEIRNILQEIGYEHQYNSVSMYLEDKTSRRETFKLLSLNDENKEKYLEVINNAFSDIPHGTYYQVVDVEEFIKKSDESNHFFMVTMDNNIIGFINIEIDNDRGLFDIGLCKEHRGKGNGKVLLETAIDFLNKKSIKHIELIVIKKNFIAYNMYKKRGFKEKSILGYWFQVK